MVFYFIIATQMDGNKHAQSTKRRVHMFTTDSLRIAPEWKQPKIAYYNELDKYLWSSHITKKMTKKQL
jgi:hypothetical protein